jgi:cyanophycinase
MNRLASFILALSLALTGSVFAAEPVTTPKLMLVGGGRMPDAIASKFVAEAGGEKARIVVIPSASESANDPKAEEIFLKQWQSFKPESLVLLHAKTSDAANGEKFADPIKNATAVWLSGGDQTRLTTIYRGTAVEKELSKLLERGGIIGGTSAGMAVQSETMIEGGNPIAKVSQGFGWLPGCVCDQHFLKRDRMNRLLGVLKNKPKLFGLGIDESTAALVKGDRLELIGESYGLLVALDREGFPFFQILKPGDKTSLKDWRDGTVFRRKD